MKKIIILFIVFSVLFCTYSFSFGEDLDLFGESAILIDYDTLEVLYEKNAHKKLYPASTTKILTGILAIENADLNDIITIDQEVVDLRDGSHIALEPGEKLTLKQLLDALLIESANDAAIAIAKHISGSVDSFSKLMNEKAESIGALNTHFVNPSGLPDENHLTTAYDLAIIAKYAMENETFRDIVKNYRGSIPITNKKTEQRLLNSSNRILYSNEKILVDGDYVPIRYEGVNGVKTGYTHAAEYCLVTSLEKDGQKFIAVSLKSNRNNIYTDTHKLLNYGMENFKKTKIGFAGKFVDNFNIENGVMPIVPGVTKSDSFFILNKNNQDNITEKVILKKDLKAPIAKDEVIGKVQYMSGDKVIGESDILSTIDVRAVKAPTLISKLLSKWYIFALVGLFVFRFIVLYNRKKRRRRRRIKSLYKA